jgi:hypothetical protein
MTQQELPSTRQTIRTVNDRGFDELEWASLNSVEITRNSKGETQWSVKVYNVEPHKATDEAILIYDSLALRYGVKAE